MGRDLRASGYTLIEILGAFFIMTVILTMVTGIFVENGRQRAAALGMMRESLSATTAIDRMAQDIEAALFLSDREGREPQDNPWRFIGDQYGEVGARYLRFVSQNAPASNRAEHASGWVEIVYFLEENDEEETTLWRWIGPRPPTDVFAKYPSGGDEGTMRMATDVSEFGVRFLAGDDDWIDEWDSAFQPPQSPMPKAVEVNLSVKRPARLGESEDDELMIPGPIHTRRIAIRTPPIDIDELIERGQSTSEDEGDECFTVAQCMEEGDTAWYHNEIDDDCGGDDRLCDLLIAAEDTCWSSIESSYPEVANGAPASCAE